MLQGLDDKVCQPVSTPSHVTLINLVCQVVPPDQGNHNCRFEGKFPMLKALSIARTLVKKIEGAGGHVEAVFYEGQSPYWSAVLLACAEVDTISTGEGHGFRKVSLREHNREIRPHALTSSQLENLKDSLARTEAFLKKAFEL